MSSCRCGRSTPCSMARVRRARTPGWRRSGWLRSRGRGVAGPRTGACRARRRLVRRGLTCVLELFEQPAVNIALTSLLSHQGSTGGIPRSGRCGGPDRNAAPGGSGSRAGRSSPIRCARCRLMPSPAASGAAPGPRGRAGSSPAPCAAARGPCRRGSAPPPAGGRAASRSGTRGS
jgi:hypothetical protein